MGFLDSIDWTFLEAFFGQYGKIITAICAFSAVVVSFIAALLKFLHARILKKERDEAQARLERERAIVQDQRHILTTKETMLDRKDEALRQAATQLKHQEAALRDQREEIEHREQCLDNVRLAFIGKEHDLWCLHGARKPDDYDAKIQHFRREKPIILVANLKGGVGKSTLTANLAAHFTEAGQRVLLIDADYQGSLSNMLLSADGVEESSPQITKLLAPGADVDSFESAARRFTKKLKRSALVASKYQLAVIENRVMIEYLLQEENEWDDGRYRLANVLLDDDVADTYDIALIDAPPRLTAATVNGFCASTHLLIPTVYDRMSAEAVGTFLDGVQVMKAWLNPGIDLLGVVGMLTARQDGLSAREQQAKNIAMNEVARVWGSNFHFFDRHIPRKEAIATAAGEDIAYYQNADVKRWFDTLGDAVLQRLLVDQRQKSRQPRGADEWSEWVRTAMADAAE